MRISNIPVLITDAAAYDDLDDAARLIQDAIDQGDGGLAGIFFSDYTDINESWSAMPVDRRKSILMDYLLFEIKHGLTDDGEAESGAGAATPVVPDVRSAVNIYRVSFSATCPADNEHIDYKLEIRLPTMLMVEEIKRETASIKSGFHEEIADILLSRIGGEQRMVAVHQGVEIETYRKA